MTAGSGGGMNPQGLSPGNDPSQQSGDQSAERSVNPAQQPLPHDAAELVSGFQQMAKKFQPILQRSRQNLEACLHVVDMFVGEKHCSRQQKTEQTPATPSMTTDAWFETSTQGTLPDATQLVRGNSADVQPPAPLKTLFPPVQPTTDQPSRMFAKPKATDTWTQPPNYSAPPQVPNAPLPLPHGSPAPSAVPQPPSHPSPPPLIPEGILLRPPPPKPAGEFERAVKKLEPLLARTIIDFEACRDVVANAVTEQEGRIQEEVQSRSQQIPKLPQPIEKYRKATICQTKWEEMSGTQQFRLCVDCKLYVYDFKNVGESEAQQIVFRREGKQNPNLYKRKDGKFLTSDCPVGAQRGRTAALAIGGTAMVIVVGLLLALLIPHSDTAVIIEDSPPPPIPEPVRKAEAAKSGTAVSQKQTPSDSADELLLPTPTDIPVMPEGAHYSNEPVAADVMDHPYVNRQVIPPGGYPTQTPPVETDPFARF